MNKIKCLYLTAGIAATIALSSCEKEYTNYSVSNATLQEYLEKFLYEAEARGVKSLNPQKTGLRMYFGDCDEGAAGVTYYENPIRIVIDKEIYGISTPTTPTEHRRTSIRCSTNWDTDCCTESMTTPPCPAANGRP